MSLLQSHTLITLSCPIPTSYALIVAGFVAEPEPRIDKDLPNDDRPHTTFMEGYMHGDGPPIFFSDVWTDRKSKGMVT